MADEPVPQDLDATMEDTSSQQPKPQRKNISLKLRSRAKPSKEKQPKSRVEEYPSDSSDDDLPPPPPPPRTKSPQKVSPVKTTPEKSAGEEDILTTYGMIDSDALFEEWTNKVHLVGVKIADPLIYTCEMCDQPILIYGRLLPCKHVFCYTCADKSMGNGEVCVRKGCGTPVTKLERANAGSVYVCTYGSAKHDHNGCRRTYLSERDLQAHVDHRHLKAGKKTKKKDVKKEDPRFKQQDYLHHKNVPQPQAIATSTSVTSPMMSGYQIQPSRSANLITIPIQEEQKMGPYVIPPPVLPVHAMPSMSMPPPTLHAAPFSNAVTMTGTVLVQSQPRFQSPPPNVMHGSIPPPNQRPPGPPPQLPQARLVAPVIQHFQAPQAVPGQAQFAGQAPAWLPPGSIAGSVRIQGAPVQVQQVMPGLQRAPIQHIQMAGQQHPHGQPLQGQQPHPGQPLQGQQPHPGQPLPGQQPRPGQPLQAQQPHPGQPLQAQPPRPGQPLPPQQPHPGQQLPAQQPRPGQQLPSQQQHPGQPLPAQQPRPGQPHPGQQQHPGQGPHPAQPVRPGQMPPTSVPLPNTSVPPPHIRPSGPPPQFYR